MIVLLYSEQDIDSVNLFKFISTNVDLQQQIVPILVDNQDILNTIISSTNMDVHEVPCILVLSTTNISKYEGYGKVTEFIDELLKNAEEPVYIDNEPKTTDLNSLGLMTDNDITETIKAPINQLSKKINASDVVMQNQNQNENQPKQITGNGDNSSPEKIKITSPPQTK
jgi:hypothetical protein